LSYYIQEADETEAKKAKPDDSTAKESQEESYLDREASDPTSLLKKCSEVLETGLQLLG